MYFIARVHQQHTKQKHSGRGLFRILLHEAINVSTQNYSGRGLFVVFECKRPSRTLQPRNIVAVVFSCISLLDTINNTVQRKIIVVKVSSLYFIA